MPAWSASGGAGPPEWPGGRIFVFGGEAPAGTFDETESYDPGRDAWQSWRPTARHGLGAAVVGGVIERSTGMRPSADRSRAVDRDKN